MSLKEIKDIFEKAKILFLKDDAVLLTSTVNERSLTHKFAEKLQSILGNRWSVDCEYNRYGGDVKTVDVIKAILNEYQVKIEDVNAGTVYPDIIIHKRGFDGPNLVVIEAKKDATPRKRGLDLEKLKKIKEEYEYSFSVFINFLTKKQDISVEFI